MRRLPCPHMLVVGALAALCAGCAAGGVAPTTAPRATDLLQPARVPNAPSGLDPTLQEAWTALRTQPTVAVEAAWVGVPPDVAASPVGLTARGFLALRRGDVNGARDAFGTALAAAPDLAVAAYGMGLVAALRGEDALAGDWFQAALRADPTLTRAAVETRRLGLEALGPALLRAEQAEGSGDNEAAEAAYFEAVTLDPWLAGPWLRIADLRAARGDTQAAIELLRDARRRTGESVVILERLGNLLRDDGRYAEAADVLQRVADAQPGDPRIAALAREARDLYERSALPEEYRSLQSKQVISREELAALLAINLDPLAAVFRSGAPVIVADAVDRWSTPFIQRTVMWGVLDVYQNNDFFPTMQVRRSMLVEACFRVLEAVGAAADAPRPALADPPPEHLLYRPAQAVIGLDLMQAESDGTFDLLAPVSGAEALRTVQQLAAVIRRYGA